MSKGDIFATLGTFGEQGVVALANATPIDSGRTADSWYFRTEKTRGGYSISWHNDNVNDGQPIAILIQYGHGTGTGGYVQGRDYINPAIRPVFDKIAEDVWKAVRSA
jgi:hypothetical protein